MTLSSCTRCISDFEKRFCFDLTFDQRPNIVYTFQALSENDRKQWLDAMDGKEPVYLTPGKSAAPPSDDEYQINEIGFAFVKKCIECLEQRGLEEEGLYRVNFSENLSTPLNFFDNEILCVFCRSAVSERKSINFSHLD